VFILALDYSAPTLVKIVASARLSLYYIRFITLLCWLSEALCMRFWMCWAWIPCLLLLLAVIKSALALFKIIALISILAGFFSMWFLVVRGVGLRLLWLLIL